jgi:ketosteroid isomerase-like protein
MTVDQSILARMVDERAITEVLHRYCRAADRFDLELMRSCYHDDAVDDHGIFCGPVDDFIAFLKKFAGEGTSVQTTMHTIANIIIELDGDVAETECHGVFYMGGEDEDGAWDEHAGGRYCDRLERREGEWRIVYRKVVYEWSRLEPRGRRAWDNFDQSQFTYGARDRSDYIYNRWKPGGSAGAE